MNKRLKDFLLAPGKFLVDVFQYISWVKVVIFIMIIIVFANIGVFVYKHNIDHTILDTQVFDVDKVINPYSGDIENGADALPFGAGMADQNGNATRTQPDTLSVFESKIKTSNTLDPIAKIKIVTSDSSDGFFAGDTIFLSAIDSYDPDGAIKEYRWDFDQSNGLNIDATGVTSTVKYNTPGVYTITLTVIDEAGLEDFTALTLTIQARPDESPNILGISTSLVDFTNLDYVSRAELTNSMENAYAEFYMTATSTMAQAIYNSQAKTLPALPALSDIELSATLDAKYGLSIDSVIPRDGSSTYETKPILSATFYGTVPTDMDSIELILDGQSVTQYTTKMQYGVNYTPIEPLSFGTHHATIIVADENGQKTTKSWVFTIKDKDAEMDEAIPSYIDEQGPQLILRVPDSNAKAVKPSTSIKLSYDEPVDTESFQLAIVNKETNVSQIFTASNVEWNATNTGAIISSSVPLFEYETSYQIATRQKDEEGNESIQEWFITTEAYGAPTITITSPKDNSTVNKPELTVTGYADTTYLVTVDGVTAMVSDTGAFTATISLEMGENKLEIVSKDLNGKKDTQYLYITYDPTANEGNPIYVSQDSPVIMDASIKDGESVKEVRPQISFVYADSDDIDTKSIKLLVDDKDVTELSFITRDSITYKPLEELTQGEHTIEFIIADTHGNTTKYEMTFMVDAYPEAPTQLTAKLSNNNKNVLLMWDTVTNKNTPEYRVYRSTSSGVTATAAYEVARTKNTTWEDKEVIDGVVYYYVVAAASTENVISNTSNEVKIRVDSTPPDFLIVKPVKNEETPFQEYPLEGLINDSDVEKISVYLNNRLYATPTMNSDKMFTVDLLLEPGDNIIQTIVVDKDGNESIDIRLLTYIPPDVDRPYATYLSPKGTDVPVNSNIVITYNEEMDFSRTKMWVKPTSNPDEVVPLTYNDITLQISDDKKTITYNPASNLEYLTEYSVIVEAWDVSGNLSLDDDWNFITAPKDAPILEVETPVEGASYDTPDIFVSGMTEPKIKITIQINGRTLAPDITSLDNGAFSKLIKLDDYENIVKIIATDDYNNTTTVTRNVYYNKPDTIPPTLNVQSPETNSYVGEDHITVSGQTEPGSSVVITVNGKDQGKVEVDNNGRFNHEVELLRGINEIIIRATDPAGNVTTQTIIVTYDAIGPIVAIQNPPDGFTTNENRIEIRGIVEASDYQATTRLYLTINNGSRTEIVVLRDGGFNQFINLVQGINTIKIYAEDSYGNTTERSLNVYYDPIGTTGELANSNTTQQTPTNPGGATPFGTQQNATGSNSLLAMNNSSTQNSNTTQQTGSSFANLNVNSSELINSALFTPVNQNTRNDVSLMANNSTQQTNNYTNGNNGGTTDVIDPSTDERRYWGGDNGAPDLTVSSENGDITTNKNNIISGQTEQEAKVTVTQNGQNRYTGKADSDDGSFSANVTLNEGHNIFTTTSTDVSGNMTFNTQVVELDTTGPILNVLSPSYNQKIGDSPFLVTGNTEPNTRTEIYVGGRLKKEFSSNISGYIQQEIELDSRDEGNTYIKVIVYDKMNNTTIVETPVKIDLTAPTVSEFYIKDAFATDNNLVIQNNSVTTEGRNGVLIGTANPFARGKTEPNATVQILLSNNILGSTEADQNGNFDFKFGVSSTVYSQNLIFKVIDTFGNYSTYDFILRTDANAPTIKVYKPSGVMDGSVTNTVSAVLSTTGNIGSAKLNGQIIVEVTPETDGQFDFEVTDESDYISYKIIINGTQVIEENNIYRTRTSNQGSVFHIQKTIPSYSLDASGGISKIEIIVIDEANNIGETSISTISMSHSETILEEDTIARDMTIQFQPQDDPTDYGYSSISFGKLSMKKDYYKAGETEVKKLKKAGEELLKDVTFIDGKTNPYASQTLSSLLTSVKNGNSLSSLVSGGKLSSYGSYKTKYDDIDTPFTSASQACYNFVKALLPFI